MNPVYVGDESIDTMISGVKAMAIMYSGDAAAVMSENPNMGYYMPESGNEPVVRRDGYSERTPKTRNSPMHLLNYASDYDGAYDNSSYVGYTSD